MRGSLHNLREAEIEEDDRKDCLMVLLMSVGVLWQLGLAPPSDVQLPSTTRAKAKKARGRVRDIAQKFFAKLPADFGADSVGDVTPWQQGMVDGSFEWPIWTLENREAELANRKQGTAAPSTPQPIQGAAAEVATEESPAVAGKKDKKAKDSKKPGGEEDLDALLNEFGVTIEAKKSKNKKR